MMLNYLKIILDPLKLKSTCFFCLKENETLTDVYEKFYIRDDSDTMESSLVDIVKYFLPTLEIICQQACIDCANLLLKVYLLLRKNIAVLGILNTYVQSLNNGIDDADCNAGKIYLNLYKEKTKNKNSDDVKPSLDISSCKKCEMKFNSNVALMKHKNIVHQNVDQSFVCEFCGKDCKKPSSLRVHLNCHKAKSCPYCSKKLKSHSHFKLHVKNHETIVKPHCRKKYYSCSNCDYKSLNKKSLEAHINKVHLQTRPYMCEICDKGFFKKSNLTEHLLTHKDNKNLMCELCAEKFVCKKTLKEHLRLHSGEKPFQCHICNEKFITSGRRSDHFKRRHMEKTICCLICDKKFSLRKELNTHMKKSHSLLSNNYIQKNNLNNVFHSYIEQGK